MQLAVSQSPRKMAYFLISFLKCILLAVLGYGAQVTQYAVISKCKGLKWIDSKMCVFSPCKLMQPKCYWLLSVY